MSDNKHIEGLLFELVRDNNNEEFIKTIKKYPNFDINIKDENNNHLLNYAIALNNAELVNLLLKKGAILDIVDPDGKSILFTPIKFNFINIINIVLSYNRSNIGISILDIKDRNGHIPLHYAIMFKNEKLVKLLIDEGSNVNYVDNNNNNALHHAIYSRNYQICKSVITPDLDINARTSTGETALHLSCNLQLDNITKLLIDNNIDIDAQDNEHEVTALHYSAIINNKKIIEYLLNKKAEVNVQDFLGNTALHYSISEEHNEIFNLLMTDKNSKDKINLNIHNYESKLPIHLVLEKNDTYALKYLLEGSNLNYQNLDGNTALHYLSASYNLWNKYKDILVKKKLNIFIKNKEKKAPINLVDPVFKSEYMEMVTNSYLYILRNYNFLWKENWENICTKKLIENKLSHDDIQVLKKEAANKTNNQNNNDLCKIIIVKKLEKLDKQNEKGITVCNELSYPVKKNKQCVKISNKINEGINNLEFCSFTGLTLDVLIGLIYLLTKHDNACSTLSTDFIENNELCAYYRNIGIITRTKCEFLNFEIVWIHQRLYLSNGFTDNFNKCKNSKNKNKRFIIIPLGIELRATGHANYLIYDMKTNEIERFEPYGSHAPHRYDYNATLLDKILESKFKDMDNKIKYVKPSDYLPKISFQYFDALEDKTRKLGDPGGFCALWAIWYTDQRIIYPEINRRSLVKKIMAEIKMQQLSFRNLIRNYSKEITDIRDSLFKKANITINDWINDQYTEEQIIIIIEQITSMINSFT